jgi:hypothetical protein
MISQFVYGVTSVKSTSLSPNRSCLELIMKDLKGFLFHFSFATTIATALLWVPFMIAGTAAHAAVIDFSTAAGYSDGNLDAQPSGGTYEWDVSWDASDWKVVGERAEITSEHSKLAPGPLDRSRSAEPRV